MQKTLIYIDVRTKAQIRATGSNATTADYPVIERGQWQVLCIQFVDRIVDVSGTVTLRPATFNVGTSFVLIGDNNFDDTDTVMFKSYQSTIPFNTTDPTTNRMNIEGDWVGGEFKDGDWIEGTNYTADISKGQLSIRINADTQKFADAIANKARMSSGLYINIKQYLSGIDNPSTIAWFNFVASNTVRDWSEATENVPEGSNLTPFIDSYLRNPIEMEFSVDGISWHKEQTAEDEYYHFRIANTSTQWSDVVRIPKGENGGGGTTPVVPFTILYGTQKADGTFEWVPAEYVTKENLGDTYELLIDSITHICFMNNADGTLTAPIRTRGNNGSPGADGYTPIKGTDYWTAVDKAEIKQYVDDAILNGEW